MVENIDAELEAARVVKLRDDIFQMLSRPDLPEAYAGLKSNFDRLLLEKRIRNGEKNSQIRSNLTPQGTLDQSLTNGSRDTTDSSSINVQSRNTAATATATNTTDGEINQIQLTGIPTITRKNNYGKPFNDTRVTGFGFQNGFGERSLGEQSSMIGSYTQLNNLRNPQATHGNMNIPFPPYVNQQLSGVPPRMPQSISPSIPPNAPSSGPLDQKPTFIAPSNYAPNPIPNPFPPFLSNMPSNMVQQPSLPPPDQRPWNMQTTALPPGFDSGPSYIQSLAMNQQIDQIPQMFQLQQMQQYLQLQQMDQLQIQQAQMRLQYEQTFGTQFPPATLSPDIQNLAALQTAGVISQNNTDQQQQQQQPHRQPQQLLQQKPQQNNQPFITDNPDASKMESESSIPSDGRFYDESYQNAPKRPKNFPNKDKNTGYRSNMWARRGNNEKDRERDRFVSERYATYEDNDGSDKLPSSKIENQGDSLNSSATQTSLSTSDNRKADQANQPVPYNRPLYEDEELSY